MPDANPYASLPRVLLVDDSPWLRQSVRAALERAGVVVVGEASDGAQALTQAATHQPDLVLMDLCMPGMDGIQATQALRRQQPKIRVVLWTAQDDVQLATAIRRSGAHAGLPKGVRTVELIATLRTAHRARGRPADAPTAS